MRPLCAAAITAVMLTACAAAAHAKDGFGLRICGSSGCKLVVGPRGDGAALATVAVDYRSLGLRHVSSGGPYYLVRFVDARGVDQRPTYRLPRAVVDEVVATSEPLAAEPLRRDVAGVRPFEPTLERGPSSPRWLIGAATTMTALGIGAVLERLRTRSVRAVRRSGLSLRS